MESRNAVRHTGTGQMRLEAPPERVFPLLCPVREDDWIENWSCEIVYTGTGVAELGAIFTTRSPEAGEEVWTISRYEPPRAIEFVRVAAQVWVVTLAFALEPDGTDATVVRTRHTYTALSRAGALAIGEITPERAASYTRAMEQRANYYLATGQMLRQPAHPRS